MALPELPAQGQNPWYTPRTDWDNSVKAEIEGRLSDTSLGGSYARVVSVEKYGAKSFPFATDGASVIGASAQDYLDNDAAFVAATADVLANGGTLNIPNGVYPMNKWRIEASGTKYLNIQGNGSVLLCNPSFANGTAAGDPFVYIGSPTAGPNGEDFLRQVTIRDLNIQGRYYQIGGTKIDRAGLVTRAIQEADLHRVWVSQFSWTGWLLDTMYDSNFYGCGVAWCGNSSPTSSPNPANRYAMDILSTVQSAEGVLDNNNALRFWGLHLEYCPLILRMDDRNRHIFFIGGKSEHGRGSGANSSELSPFHFKACKEIGFSDFMFVQNQYDLQSGQVHPYHVTSDVQGIESDTLDKPKKTIRFINCDFTTPDPVAEHWVTGHQMVFEACTFARCIGNGPTRPAFNLGNACRMTDCTYSFADVVLNDGVPVTATMTLDSFRFSGGNSAVINPVLYYPSASGLSGSFVRVGTGAVNNRMQVNGFPWGAPTTMWAVDSGTSLETNLLAVIRDPGVEDIGTPGTPDLFGRYSIRLDPGTYTNFTGGYIGQRVVLRARGALTLTNNASLVTGTGADLAVISGGIITVQRMPGFWAVV